MGSRYAISIWIDRALSSNNFDLLFLRRSAPASYLVCSIIERNQSWCVLLGTSIAALKEK
jgi:hypothetical protein